MTTFVGVAVAVNVAAGGVEGGRCGFEGGLENKVNKTTWDTSNHQTKFL